MKKKAAISSGIIAALLIILLVFYIYDMMRERTTAERLARIVHTEDRRRLTSDLKDFLTNADPVVRSRASLAVGRIGGAEAAELLYRQIGDSSIDVASMAAFAIGLTGQGPYASRMAEIALDLPGAVAARAVEAAGRLADSSMTDVGELLTQYLEHPSPDVRDAACMAIFRAGAKSKAPAIIELLATETDDLVRLSGLYALARMGVAEAENIYEEFLADNDPFARALAVRGMGKVKNEDAARYLAIALNDADPKVVAQAIGELSGSKASGVNRHLVRKLRSESDENLMVLLFGALQKRQAADGLDYAMQIMDGEPSVNIVIATLTYITQMRNDRAVNLIDSMLTTKNSRIMAACAVSYGMVASTNVIPRIATLFNDEDPMVRTAALTELVKLDTANVDFYLKTALNDDDFVVVTTAVNLIEKGKRPDYLPQLQEMMAADEQFDVDVRRSLISAAKSFLESDSGHDAALRIVEDGLMDREYIIRKDAAEAYLALFEQDRFDVVTPSRTQISEGRLVDLFEKDPSITYATVVTNRGEIEIELYHDVAPLTVLNFIDLASRGFYDGLSFHRVLPNFVIQGGDPRGDGWGGLDYFIRCEYSDEPYRRGTVGIATSGKDSGSSQFFITLSPQPHLEARYTVFGQVISGFDVVEKIVRGDLIEEIRLREELL